MKVQVVARRLRAARSSCVPKPVGAAAAVLLAGLLLAACGSSSSGSGASVTSQASKSALTQAEAYVKLHKQAPATIPITQKLTKPVPSGKSVYYVNCGTPVCVDNIPILQQAARLLHWKLTTLNTDGSSGQIATAWAQILRDRPDGVVYAGTPRSIFNRQLQEAGKRGVEVVAANVTDPPTQGLDAVISGGPAVARFGQAQAAWVAATSKGKADTVYVTLPGFPILASVASGFFHWYPKYCPDCQLSKLPLTLADVGTSRGTTAIVAYLRSHPDTKFVALSLDAFAIGLPAALRAAGLSDVQIVGEAPTGTNLAYLASGQEAASVYLTYYLNDFLMMDALARIFSGVPLVRPAQPVWLLTKANLPAGAAKGVLEVPGNLVKQFAALWGVNGQ